MKIHAIGSALFLAAAAASLSLGCGKGDKSDSGSAAASSAAAATAAATGAAPAGGGKTVAATCTKAGTCVEYKAIADGAETLCTMTEGKWQTNASPCTTDKLVGTCAYKNPERTAFFYGTPDDVEIQKGLCEALEGKWAPPPAAATGTAGAAKAPPAGGGAAPAKADAPATKPAVPAKPAPAPKKKK